ncbi:MAG: hypothetical protein MUC49_12855 [Raineya sp.]|jgi:hypothetical protein|nr:hypothetical protein [Raineya sp.]
MKKFFRQIVALTMLLVIFITNTGFVVVKHHCKMRGERTFLFAKPQNLCCPADAKPEKPVFDKPACCIEKFNLYKLSIDLNTFSVPALDFAIPQEFFSFEFTPTSFVIAPIQEDITNYPNPPPLLSGKILLHHICSYLI